MKNISFERWTIADSSDLYGVGNWGAGYFSVSEKGEVSVSSGGPGGVKVSLMDILSGIRARGQEMPVLIRFENILDSQIALLNESFTKAISDLSYNGIFRGVYPVKVNQQQHIIEEIAKYGANYHHGLEAGSKPELIAAISMIRDLESCLVCNGYKDKEYIDLALYARKMGMQCFIVIERPSELPLVIKRARELNVKPLLGARIKLSTSAGGHWSESGGARSVFGLNMTQLVEVVETLKREGMLDCLRLLHYHLGSQIPNIRDIRAAALEASRVYAGLVEEGAQMGFLNLGGGLAVDYDGSHTNFDSSRNYTLGEYCTDVVETVMSVLDPKKITHPTIITESGRATVAYSSVLIFNVLDVSRHEDFVLPSSIPEDSHDILKNLYEVMKTVNSKNLQESYNDAIFYRDEIRAMFSHGRISLRDRAVAESIFWQVVREIGKELHKLKYIPDEFERIESILADIYYCNFSVFQSIPDAWAIGHLFPIMPIHRLSEAPGRQGVLADITCDCDGKIDKFIDLHDVRHTLPLHELKPDEEYYLGAFLVGAYQETLGDLHNLFGDTNVISIRIEDDGSYRIIHEIDGDSVEDVLSYVEYDTKAIIARIRKIAEEAIRLGNIEVGDRREIIEAFEAGFRGYTYFNRETYLKELAGAANGCPNLNGNGKRHD